jgi:hypothetical protein
MHSRGHMSADRNQGNDGDETKEIKEDRDRQLQITLIGLSEAGMRLHGGNPADQSISPS